MDTRARAWVQHSVAEVHATTFVIPVARERLELELAQALPAASLEHLSGPIAGRHPLLVELWQVNDGHLAPSGVDTLTSSEQYGAVLGGIAGGLLGAAAFSTYAGAIALLRPPRSTSGDRRWIESGVSTSVNQAFGALLGTWEGANAGARVGSRTMQRATRGIVSRWGSYQEMLLAIPGVRLAGEATPRQLVLGMYTDSSLARWGERVLGYGFGKQAAKVHQRDGTSFEVLSPAGMALFRGHWSAGSKFSALAQQPPLVPSWWSQPLLGLRRGQPVLSQLERRWQSDVTEFREISGALDVGAGVLPGLLSGHHEVQGGPADLSRARGFQTRSLRVHLSFPRRASRVHARKERT